MLAWSGLAPQRLELEVTESLLITDSNNVLHELQCHRRRWADSLALDDFGTKLLIAELPLAASPSTSSRSIARSSPILTVPRLGKSRRILATIVALGHVLESHRSPPRASRRRPGSWCSASSSCDLVRGLSWYGRPQRCNRRRRHHPQGIRSIVGQLPSRAAMSKASLAASAPSHRQTTPVCYSSGLAIHRMMNIAGKTHSSPATAK